MMVFEVIYEVVATCKTQVAALTPEDAKNMVRTGEAGDVVDDHVGYERTVIDCREATLPSISNADPGDEQGA